MSVVLAFEPDGTKVDELGEIVRMHFGAELTFVTSAYAAITAINQRTPDLVLIGKSVSSDQRAKVTGHIVSSGVRIPTLDIPELVIEQASGFGRFGLTGRKKKSKTEDTEIGRAHV